MPYILFILGLLFANLKTEIPTQKQNTRTTTHDRSNPEDNRDYIIVDMTTP